jgi:hypothetical protein
MSTELDLSHPDLAPAPTTLFDSPDPAKIVAQATRIANAIAPLIRDQHLVKRIQQSEHVFLEGWTLAGSMLGVFPVTIESGPLFDADGRIYGYQATVEARTMAGGVVGRADAECTRDENEKWEKAPSFQLRSMAQTRGASKAMRLALGFVMKLAGYETTPAEEMEAAAARGETVSGGKGVAGGWRDIGEQIASHKRMDAYVTEHGLADWVAVFLDSKGYQRPLSKGQMADLRRAMERERSEQSDPGSRTGGVGSMAPGDAGESAPHSPGSDPTSPSSATSPAGGGGHQSPPARSDLGRETHAGGGHKSPPTPNAREHSPMEADRVGVEGAQPDGTEPGAGSRDGATSPPDGPPPPGRASGGTKGPKP